MKLLLATFLAMFLFIPNIAMPQVSCFTYGSGTGAPIISCDSPSGNTTIAPLSRNQGVIQSDRYGTEPYTIITPQPRERFSSRPLEPLDRIDRLDDLDRLDRFRSHRDDDLLLPLLLGE